MKYFITLFYLFLFAISAYCQQQNETLEQKAHNKKIKLEEFSPTDQAKFKIKVFTVDKKAVVNKTHHWFVQLLSSEDTFLNYADVELKGYFKTDPDIDFHFMNPVMKLCSEGKYIVGFTKVKHAGIYVLHFKIDNFGEQDKVMVEIEIPEKNDELIK